MSTGPGTTSDRAETGQAETSSERPSRPAATAEDDVGIAFLNFGEPPTPDRERVLAYLERIFLANAELEGDEDPQERAETLARRRAPGLLEEYNEIGGSPLNEQARGQAETASDRLAARGYDVEAYLGMQYTEPLIETAVERARADDVRVPA